MSDIRSQKPIEAAKETRPRGHRTQWAAQFAVASELCKRGYEVSFTMGNSTPIADLMVISPVEKQMFLIDVKGLYRANPWLIKRKAIREGLFYVLAYVPEGLPNEFFVLSQNDAHSLIQSELERLQRPDDYGVTGFSWKMADRYRDGWKALPK